MTRDWRNAAEYAGAAHLNRARWAWEFLRRHPGYRTDWQWFWQTWQALEADYGAPPQRDFTRWKRDPRAFRQESDADGGCVVDDDKLLIECWMGAKWGFYKFPLDPARDAASLDEDPVWREAGRQMRVLGPDETTGSRPNLVALAFDLARPLKEQFEQARFALVDLQRRFKREGGVLETVSTMAPRWTLALRVLDAEDAGASPATMKEILSLDDAGLDEIRAFAHRMRNRGYREILLLPQK